MDAGGLLKSFMRGVAQPVFIVTARSEYGYSAFTASSVTSISLDPPLMMVSVAKGSRSHDPLVGSRYFIISLLDRGGVDVASIMAGREEPLEKLRKAGFRDTEYGPLVNGSAAYLVLEKYRVYDGGDHSIVLGRIIDGSVPGVVECPLLYHNRSYTSVRGC
ncbi:MAG: flavin reductase family protein [Desulfurococcales archaeon]|nr:flavin reductase family protein [Desulfurococcales archaeon]